MKSNFIAHYLIAAVISDYMTTTDWIAWADSIIDNTEEPDYWIIDVALTNDKYKLLIKLEEQLYNEQMMAGKLIYIDEIILGYYFLRFLEGNLLFKDFIELSAKKADSGYTDIDCEEIYSILNKYEKLEGEGEGESTKSLIVYTKEKFIKYAEIAKFQWSILINMARN